MKACCLAIPCVLLALITGRAEASITINSSQVYALGDDFTGSSQYQTFNGTTIPTFTTLNAGAVFSYSKNAIDWSVIDGQTVLSFDMEHRRAGTLGAKIDTGDGLTFTANANEPYEFSGYYNVTNIVPQVGTRTGYSGIHAELSDLTAGGPYLFSNSQDSQNTTNETYVLGGAGGDYYNSLTGNITGNLIAGHQYQLFFYYTMGTVWPNGDSGSTALGNFTMKIGTAAVPEPTSLALVSIAAVMLGSRRRLEAV